MQADIRNIDTLVYADWILPVVPAGTVLENCALAIDQGRILALSPRLEAQRRFCAQQVFDLPNSVLLPGLVNAHGHTAMSLLRGYAEDQRLQQWLEEAIWPAETRWVSEDFVHDGTELGVAEMLLGGTTCFSDMYFFPDQAARVASAAGMRCQLAFPILEFPTAWARNAEEYIHKGLALYDQYRQNPLINVAFGPHAPYTVADSTFEQIALLSDELEAPLHIHLHETQTEIEESLREHGRRPLHRLNDLGLLSNLTQAVHMVHASDEDIELLVDSGAQVIHCPESNLKLGSGFCPAADMLKAGINVALGTDGAASNNDLQLFGEAKTAALLAKGCGADPSLLPAHTALEMITLNGARALGLEQDIGSLEVGKSADLIAVQFDAPGHHPIYNVAAQLLYTEMGRGVSHSWVQGQLLVRDGQLQSLDAQRIVSRAQQWQRKIAAD